MAKVFRDIKIPTGQDEKVKEAVSALADAILGLNNTPKGTVIQEIIVSHPGNSDSMIHLRTATDE